MRTGRGWLAATAGAIAITASVAVAWDVPYVPTPPEVVARMLQLAQLKAGDVVYDLGCGDGRIVIEAVKTPGVRGVGVDIDPERIAEARANATQAGVQDRVRFVQGNLFEVPIAEATVVTLYLLPDVNLRLRPRLQSELRPGTRIVSHAFDMGDWKPEAQETMELPNGHYNLFKWTIAQRTAQP